MAHSLPGILLHSSRIRRSIALFALLLSLVLAGCGLDRDNPAGPDGSHLPAGSGEPVVRHRGVNLDGGRSDAEALFDGLEAAGVDWIALIPFGWQPRYDVPRVELRTTGVRWAETDEGLRELARQAQARGMGVLIKPHIWLLAEVPDQWRGSIDFAAEADWQRWEEDYRQLILHYAGLAADSGMDLFCVGVELGSVVKQRPAFWPQLIEEVRAAFAGPITYAANWDDYGEVPFWGLVDYIGVDAYFPLTGRQDATVEQLVRGWEPHRQALQDLCDRQNRPVLFLEAGYRSIAGAAVEPWDADVDGAADPGEQADAYEALFRAFWDLPWFAGLFLWEWNATGYSRADDFSPQGKPAEAVLTRWYTARD